MPNQTRNLFIVALIAALVVAIGWKQSPGQVEPAKPAVSWEYLVVTAEADTLNTFAEKQHWEVCAAFSKGSGDKIVGFAILRRPKAARAP